MPQFLDLASHLHGDALGGAPSRSRSGPTTRIPSATAGDFVPPLVMGSLYGSYGSYALGLVLLASVAVASLAYTGTRMRRTTVQAS